MTESKNQQAKKIVIAGGGPAGLLLCHALVRKENYDIVLIEKRSDPTAVGDTNTISASDEKQKHVKIKAEERTYPMALQSRGMDAMKEICDSHAGIETALAENGVYTSGITLHGKKTNKNGRFIKRDNANLSMDRNQLTCTLLEELKAVVPKNNTTLTLKFDTLLQHVDLKEKNVTIVDKKATMQNPTSIDFDYLVAADGARSRVRQTLVEQGLLECRVKEIPDDYRSLTINRLSKDGTSELLGERIHGWMLTEKAKKDDGDDPKKEDNKDRPIRVISVPINPGTSDGVIIFEKGHDPFVNMTTANEVFTWMDQLTPPNYLSQFVSEDQALELLRRPTSTNLAVRCKDKLHYSFSSSSSAVVDDGNNKTTKESGGGVLLLGDAAHAVSASLGQGANSSLQDIQVFNRLLNEYDEDWEQALPAYTMNRLDDAHAVTELSDYTTPRTKWMRIEYILRMVLKLFLPIFLSKLLLKPLPMDLLSETTLTYTEVLEQTNWWVSRVKRSMEQQQEQ